MNYFLIFLFWMSLLFSGGHRVFGEEITFFGSLWLDPPEAWQVLDITDDKLTLSDSSGGGFLQVKIYPGSRFSSASEIFLSVKSELGGSGEGSGFSFSGRDAYLADIAFQSGGFFFRGYVLTIESERINIVVLSFADANRFEELHGELLSVMDSFSADDGSTRRPGPVSRFYYPSPGPEPVPFVLENRGKSETVLFDPGEFESAQIMIEREAFVLQPYIGSRLMIDAWRRFYRMIYRDNHVRVRRFARPLKRLLFTSEMSDYEKSSVLLSFIQGFEYKRPGGASDILSPAAVLLGSSGDCDSRGLLYVSLLHEYGIDAILMVSHIYGHSMVGVDVEGPGARFSFEGRQYLVAETTEQIGIGLIEASMADPAGWIGIDFIPPGR